MIAAVALAALLAGAADPRRPPQPRTREVTEKPSRDELRDQLDAMIEAHERFREEAEELQRDVHALVERKYEDRKSRLESAYERELADLEADERAQRDAAIARFEEFVRRHPSEPRYTPDALFRLAELRFEQAKDEHRAALRAFAEQARAASEGAPPPAEPRPSFDKCVALYRKIADGFPGFRHADGVHYLLGYVLDQQGDAEGTLRAFADVAAKFPQSRFVPEAWMRIGEHWFALETTNDVDAGVALSNAAAAYAKLLDFPDHKLFDKALYKLGWTHYRNDDFGKAVDAFVRLVDAYEARRKGSPDAGAAQGELRDEALQYTAVSFADEAWGGVDKAIAHFAELGGRPWQGELFRRLGDLLFEQRKNHAAVTAYRAVLQKEPAAPDAPDLHQRIVQAYERERETEKAWAARDALILLLADGSPWFEANKNDPAALKKTRAVAEKSLAASASFHHRQGLAHKGTPKAHLAQAEFVKAAAAYEAFLQRFPHARNVYETRFYLAEALYNAGDFERAAAQYGRVRDDPREARFLADAAYGAVLSLQKEIEQQERKGTLPRSDLWKAAERPKDRPIHQRPLAPAWRSAVEAADTFVKLLPNDERAADVAYKAAEAFYRHDDFDEARTRFESVIARWPASAVAQVAANYTLETYLAEGDWQRVEEFSGKQLADRGGALDVKDAAELSKLKSGARFQRAQRLMDAKKWSEAAELFLMAVDDDPKVEFADKALNNAAFCRQQESKFEAALQLYERLFRLFPTSPLADAALFLVGFSAEKAFDFDKAISVYQELVDNHPSSKKRADALYNLAHALERLQRYPDAQRAYARYAELFPERDDAPSMQMQAALLAERTKDWPSEIRELNAFIRKFEGDRKQAARVIEAWLKTGHAHRQLGDERAAQAAWDTAVAEFDRRRLTADDVQAAAAAAEARFQLAELEFARYDRIRIEARGRGAAFDRSLKAALTKKAEERERVLARYRDVAVKYKRPDWIVAALFRVGNVDERFSAALTEAPIPPELKRLGEEYVAQYQDTLAQASIPIDQRAMEAYEKAIGTARELRIANAWTRRILESLDKYDRKKWPLLKDAKAELLSGPFTPLGPGTEAGLREARAATQKLAEDDK